MPALTDVHQLHPETPAAEQLWEHCPRRIRAEHAGETVVESRRAIYVWPPNQRIVEWAVPAEDIVGELPEGVATPLAEPEGYVMIAFKKLDRWYEEAEEVFVHPRDPHHRVDAMPSDRHVRIEHDGVVLAESSNVVTLFETGLVTRYYFPPEDVRVDLLKPSDAHTRCPYKGVASYHDYGQRKNFVWHYPDPIPAAEAIRGRMAFYNHLVDVFVDGEREE